MPILAAALSGFFGFIASVLAKKLSIGLAAAGAFVATSLAALIAVKVAMAAIYAGISYAMPSQVALVLSWFLPANTPYCIAAILLCDTIRTSYDYWLHTVEVAIQVAKG